jgi:hypothetical protein
MASEAEDRVTRSHIEAKLREIRGEVDDTAGAAKPYALAAGVVAAIAVVALVYTMGKRKGRKRTTVVEVRRV